MNITNSSVVVSLQQTSICEKFLRQADISFQRFKRLLFGCWDHGSLWLWKSHL